MNQVESILIADIRESRNVKTASRNILFSIASAKSVGCHIIKVLHSEARGRQMKPFFRSLLRDGQIRLFVEGEHLGEENDAGSLYLLANFAKETAKDGFWEKTPTVTVLCV